ncbi:Charged multivesicular body protein 2a [Hondaea fermentalgiana]|uniref:Charged multivesicular body protein 2a n=1 Tax=Hondaea fermentalgiana TaxID=2315210 RepID=A0A2R5GKT5_9STRA|nr:Charged multivesicular body protein 2a [Hondaea fermentalgiana]|eukprot:GBG31490.1 Charged multivesicular body protein 2a [Hondaea fermentalgiana]
MGNRMTLQEQMRANKRVINRAVREMDRERAALEREQAKLERDIKKLAAKGEMQAVRVMAKDLVRTKQYISKFHVMRSNLQSLSLKMQTIKTQHEMGLAMGKMTKQMKRMNKKMNAASLSKMVREFEMENEKVGLTEEMMNDVMDDAFDEGDEEEEDAIVNQVLDEIGVTMHDDLQSAPQQPVRESAGQEKQPAMVSAEAEEDAAVSDLEARLNNLRRGT